MCLTQRMARNSSRFPLAYFSDDLELPSHVGEGQGWGQYSVFSAEVLRFQTPPLTPPLEGRGVISHKKTRYNSQRAAAYQLCLTKNPFSESNGSLTTSIVIRFNNHENLP